MECDCGFVKESNWFRYRAGAIIIEDGAVLLLVMKGKITTILLVVEYIWENQLKKL